MKITKISREELARELSDVARSWADGAEILRYIEAEGWLRDPAEPVPGWAITASEFDEAVESCVTEDFTVPPHTFAARLGVVCIPDPEPEPTNADILADYVRQINRTAMSAEECGKWLDRAGVKAPVIERE